MFRWDSSDPERAPPPLPLNPNTASPATKPNASKAITLAAEALTAKARESQYTINPLPPRSPEKSPTRTHQRVESLQNGNLRNRNSYTDALKSLDRSPSPEKSPERLPRTPGLRKENQSADRNPARSNTPTPMGLGSGKETPNNRSRPPLKPILGESTPPSATMLALQNMVLPKEVDPPLVEITKTPLGAHSRQIQSMDSISSQILSLTTIATSLQKEMAQLSRRSKDNATDLLSLKEATNSRDEDIRKSLKDLSINVSTRLLDPEREQSSRSTSSFGHRPGSFLLDSKPFNFDTSLPKSYSLPRMGSPGLSTSDVSGATYTVDGPASIALLEKIYRDMSTKEGQEALTTALESLKTDQKVNSIDPAITKKLEEILSAVKEAKGSQALVHLRDQPQRNNSVRFESPELRPAPLSRSTKDLVPHRDAPRASLNPKAAEFVNEDLQKLLKKMKDSITEGGGMTAEVKAHLRELRGEVLGMGRDIARRLDQAESSNASRGETQGPGREEIALVVQDGLSDLKRHMEAITRDRRRQSASSLASKHSVDSQEVYNAVKTALVELPQQELALQSGNDPAARRTEILDAVREAWETYKPEIEVQNFGLERDEILQCLKDGLQDYQLRDNNSTLGGATYEEVLDAVHEGLKSFKPPPVETEASITREEILETVRECLENVEISASQVNIQRDTEVTRDLVLEAVREGLAGQAPISKEIEFNRDDLFEAVKAGLHGTHGSMDGVGEQVLEKMEELIDGMRVEFKQYSEANGGDTEQILDAMKDGLEVLRGDIESYVDRAQDVTGKDEILETLKHSLDDIRQDLEASISNTGRAPASSNVEILDLMEKEFEHLRQTIASSAVRAEGPSLEREDILDIIRDGVDNATSSASRSINGEAKETTEDIFREEFSHLRETLAPLLLRSGSIDKDEMLEAIREGFEANRTEAALRQHRPESILSNTSELLDAFNEGLETLRSDIEKIVNRPTDMTLNYEILETLKNGLASVRSDMDRLQQRPASSSRGFGTMKDGEVVVADPDVENAYKTETSKLEMMIAQLQIKVEALDQMPQFAPPSDGASREQFNVLESTLRDVQASVKDLKDRDVSGSVGRDDMDAFETILRNTKAKVDGFASSESDGLAKVSHFESLESVLNETRDAVLDLEAEGATKKDFEVLEALLKEVRLSMDDLRTKDGGQDAGEQITRTDIEAIESLCLDMKSQIAEIVLPDPETLPSKIEVALIGEVIRKMDDRAAEQHELTAQAFEARKVEHGGLADKIEDVKLIFEDIREELKLRIEDGHSSVKDLSRTLDTVAETVMAADTSAAVNEVRETIKQEFESLRAASDGLKNYNEENHVILLEKHTGHKQEIIADLTSRIDSRFDEIMTKYDDAQLAAQEKAKAFSEKDTRSDETMQATKTAAEDLRLLVDALGSTVTEQCERIGEDSKTVFTRVEDVGSKLDELLAGDGKAEHQLTRAEISRALIGVEAIQAHAAEYDPKILDSINAVLAIVGQHYEQVRASTEEIKLSVNAIPGAIPLPAITSNYDATSRDTPSYEKYDDSAVHTKLDKLVTQATDAGKSMAEFAAFESIKEQIAATSAQLTDFIASQSAATAQLNESKAREAEEAAIVLEKRISQQHIVEASIVTLTADKANLESDVSQLRSEKDELASLKTRLQADLSALETALEIRREELDIMEQRADGLERRMLDNVLDHSRSMLSISSRPASSLKEMSRKRVSSAAASDISSATTKPSMPPTAANSAVSSAVGIALKSNRARATAANSAAGSKSGRRILSLSTLSGNRGSAVGSNHLGHDRALVLANPAANAMKRSHSVKSNFAPSRKSSWGTGGAGTRKSVGLYHEDDVEEDKENSILDEEDERSEEGTERRTSYLGTETSYLGTDLGTGSYMTGSDFTGFESRRMSLAASTVGTVGGANAIEEEGEDIMDDADNTRPAADTATASSVSAAPSSALTLASEEPSKAEVQALQQRGDVQKDQDMGEAGGMVVFGMGEHSDSGIGTDVPTAQLGSVGGSDYFKRG